MHDEHRVTLSPFYKMALGGVVNKNYRFELKSIPDRQPPERSHSGAPRLRQLIRSKFAEEGTEDPEDLYQLVIGELCSNRAALLLTV